MSAKQIDTLIAELRAGLERGQTLFGLHHDEVRALLDHIERVDGEMDEARDKAVNFVFDRLAKALKLETWTPQDGSETWDGDVAGTLYGILRDARVLDPETDELATTKLAAAEARLMAEETVDTRKDHKWFDPECGFNGCQSLIWKSRYEAAVKGRQEFRQSYRDALSREKALESELALLRAPVEGDVGEVVAALNDLSEYVFQQPPVDYEEAAAKAMTDAADLLQRLAGQVAEARAENERRMAAWVSGEWQRRTEAAEARLREAVELVRRGREANRSGAGGDEKQVFEADARAFLATLEDHSNGQ